MAAAAAVVDVDKECRAPHWSQDGEDLSVYREFFQSRTGPGTVLEMGALDGVGLSNSLFYERCLGWRAILLEGQPENCKKMFVNRPAATAICTAICHTEYGGTVEFTRDPGPIAGAPATMSPSFKKAFHAPRVLADTIRVPCAPMHTHLALHGIQHIDFFSLDVEGAELVVLDTIDWHRLTVDVMMVERDAWNDARNQRVRALLLERADMVLHSSDTLTPRSDLFVRRGFAAKRT